MGIAIHHPDGAKLPNAGDCSGTIGNGESKTCTVTNDDQPGHLIIKKVVVNDNGGTKTAADFTLDSGGTNDSPDDFAGSAAGTNVTLDAGSYAVTDLWSTRRGGRSLGVKTDSMRLTLLPHSVRLLRTKPTAAGAQR